MSTQDSPRLLLIDLENSIGAVNLRQRVLRSRISALLAAAGPVHHAAAGYAVADLTDDPIASVLAELGVAPLRVPRAPDAAELVLLAHARRVHDSLGCRTFLVASADRRFAELADLGRLELLAWQDQHVASKLENVAHQVHRVIRPALTTTDVALPGSDRSTQSTPPRSPVESPRAHGVHPFLTALATGVGIGIGQRLVDLLVRRRR